VIRRFAPPLAALLLALLVLPAAAGAQAASADGTGTALSAARVVRYLGIGGVVGLLVLALVVWAPLRARGTATAEADEAFSRSAVRALRGAALVGLVGALLALVLQGAEAGPTGFGGALRPGTLGDAAGTRAGAWFLVTAVAFALVAGLAGRVVRGAGAWPRPLAVVLAGLLVVAPALGGHAWASSPAWALVPIQAVHVAGMGAWLGGLAGLLLVLPRATRTLPAGRARHALLAAVLLRFSPVALGAVAVLTAAGTGLALLHLTTLYDLTDTAYGRAILVKVALLVGAIGVAVLQREYLLPRLRRLADGEPPADPDATEPRDGMLPAPPSPATGRHVRSALRAEVVLLVLVLCATGALAGYDPPKDLDAGPVSVARRAGAGEVRLTVAPARTGRNAMDLRALGRDGRPLTGVRGITARAVPPGKAGGSDVPVDVAFVPAGPGRWSAAAVPLGTRGGWTVEVTLRTSASGRASASLPVRVR
jgi:copper transport protein